MAMPATTTTPDVATTNGTIGWTGRAGRRSAPPSSGGAVYGLGMIGALVYFLGTSQSGPDYVLAFGKAVVWPALLVYEAFRTLGR
jgi:hypothetical protein